MELEIDLSRLTDKQLRGEACVRCGGAKGPMQPYPLIIGVPAIVHAGGCPQAASESAA
jgi:hypothetical protein